MSGNKTEIPEVQGCTDQGCVFGHPGGMATNGGCRCIDIQDPETRRRVTRNIRALRKEIRLLRDIAHTVRGMAEAVKNDLE